MRFKKSVVSGSVASAFLLMNGVAAASGFALLEQSGSGLGNAFAGAAASAEDAATIFYNPAGMSRLSSSQFAIVGSVITPSAKFANSASTVAAGGFVAAPVSSDAGSTALVPAAYFSWQLDPQWSAGLGLGAPFGLKTEYDPNWMGRFHAIKSEIKTINLNPSMAYKVSDDLSFGFGLNWQRVDATLTKAVNYAAFGAPAGTEGTNSLTGSDSAWGYNFGAMFNLNPKTTVGLAYRSSINYKVAGTAVYFGRTAALTAATLASAAAAAQIGDSAFTADLKMPASLALALKYQPNAQWDVLFDATRTQWSSVQSLDLMRSGGIASGLSLESVPFKWRDTWRVALGVNHHYSEQWTARAGLAYDQTPTSDLYRIVRLPDSDRIWLSLGGQYKPSKGNTLDFGYAHLFMNNALINMNGFPLSAAQTLGRGALVGNSVNKVDIFSVQYTHGF